MLLTWPLIFYLMRYFYERPTEYFITKGFTYRCNHPTYNSCTLYLKDNKGLSVIQQRFNPRLKITWWGPIDPWLVDDIFNRPGFADYFEKNSENCKDGLYPTVKVREIMWALKMKPIRREYWEENR